MPAARVRTAAALGLRATGLYVDGEPIPWTDPDLSAATYGDRLGDWLSAQGLGGEVETFPVEPPDRVLARVVALRALWP